MKKNYVVKASEEAKQSKINSATDSIWLQEFPIEVWDIFNKLGFTAIGENDELLAISNNDDVVVYDGTYLEYFSNIPAGQKGKFLQDMIAENSFPDVPEEFPEVTEDDLYSVSDLFTYIIGDTLF